MLFIILAIFIGCFILERLFVGWELPQVKTWPLRVVLINAVQLGIVMLAGITWEVWLSSWSIMHLSNYVSPILGGCIAYFIGTFIFYWWHHISNEFDFS